MADNELKISISGDSTAFQNELKKVSKGSGDLEKQLASLAKISAVAFTGLVAEAGLAINAFGESEAALNSLTQTMQQQGVFSKELAEQYVENADALSKLTGVEDEAIVKSTGIIQSFIGQRQVSKELSAATLDLAAGMGVDLNTAANLLGKTVGTSTNALAKYGLKLSENLSEQEKMAKVMEFVNIRFGGQAEAANKGIGSVKGLSSAFGEVQEQIGARLAPAFTAIVKTLTDFFNKLSENKPLLDLITGLGIAAGVITGAITAVAAFTAAASALAPVIGLVTSLLGGLGLGIKLLIGGTGIGLLVLLVADLALNWEKRLAQMTAAFSAFTNNLAPLLSGLGTLLTGAFSLNIDQIKAGWEQVKTAFMAGVEEVRTSVASAEPIKLPSFNNETQKAEQKELADQLAADKAEQDARERAAQTAKLEAMRLELQGHSAELVEIARQEAAILAAMADENNAALMTDLQAKHDQLLLQKEEAFQKEQEQRRVFNEEILAKNKEFQALSDAQKESFRAKEQIKIQAMLLDEEAARKKIAEEKLAAEVEEHNKSIIEREKYGAVISSLNKQLRSDEIQGAKSAANELVALENSKFEGLKTIGKAAAIVQIGIATAEGAMKAYAALASIPFIGPFLGAAAAGAVIAYGAERTADVLGLAEGGMVTGGTPGVDSVPAMLSPGELVVPEKNFAEVINAVAEQRRSNQMAAGGLGGFGSPFNQSNVGVEISFNGDEAEKVLTAKQKQAKSLGTSTEV